MAIRFFIPTIWTQTLYEELQKNYVGVNLCSRDYEGEIKNQGDKVLITSIGPVKTFEYTRNTDMPAPDILSDMQRVLVVDQARGFNFFIDSIDEVQASPQLMKSAMKKAADALSDVADKYIYSLTDANVKSVDYTSADASTVLKSLASLRRALMENNVPNSAKISLEVPPVVEELLLMANLLTDTNNSKALEKGYIGKILGFDVYVSNNITCDETTGAYRCIARTERAISFVEQINSIKTYEPELRNGTAVKGLHLYGAKIVYPKDMVFWNVSFPTEA